MLSPKSPLGVIAEIRRLPVPVLVSVVDLEPLVVFSSCPAKLRLVADRLTIGVPLAVLKVAVTA